MSAKTYSHDEQPDPADSNASALEAVQIALDRRDNGGGAAASSAK